MSIGEYGPSGREVRRRVRLAGVVGLSAGLLITLPWPSHLPSAAWWVWSSVGTFVPGGGCAVAMAVVSTLTHVRLSGDQIRITHLGLIARQVPVGEFVALVVRPGTTTGSSGAKLRFMSQRPASLVGLPRWELVRLAADLARLVPPHCATCGYDLRATPARCPECGTVPAAAGPVPGHVT